MSPFRINFDINNYLDILPPVPDDYSQILNIEKDIEDQFWQKELFPQIITSEFLFQEATRIKQGVWVMIKGVPIWIPPNYYQFLQYGIAGGEDPEFRLKRLKSVYHKLRVRKDPRFIGTNTIKNRQDGETTMCMSDNLWEVSSEELKNGMIGIQSKTRDDAENPCWFALQTHWNNYPSFFKDTFYPHFTSGKNIAEKLQFQRDADKNNPNSKGSNVIIKYGPSVANAFDGKNNMRRCVLDEIAKWKECSLLLTLTNYTKFIMPGKVRKGLFDCLSSPSDTNGKHNDEAYQVWLDSDPDNIQETGSTKNRLWRYYSNPLDGIEGFYDKYGDADPQEILEHIKRERATKSKDLEMAEIRGYPLPIIGTDQPNEEELFGATDSDNTFINIAGIKERKIWLGKNRGPLIEYGNLEWPLGNPDSGEPEFRKADKDYFDEIDARFCLTDTELPRIELLDLKTPPLTVEESFGIDPFGLRHRTRNEKTGSLGAGISWKFRDSMQTGRINYPTLTYLSRPQHQDTFHEDMIKGALYRRAMIQVESAGDKMANYFYDRGYQDWMLNSLKPETITLANGTFVSRKGDAPSGAGATAFMDEGISLINGVTNIPISPERPYLLNEFNFIEVLDDLISYNRKKGGQFNHFTMAFLQALLGVNKMLFKKQTKPDSMNNSIAAGLLD